MEHLNGIKKKHLSKAAHILSGLLADEYIISLKTRDAHWNIEGPDFHTMHKFFEEQYVQLDKIIDEVAERIRMVYHYTPATMKSYLELTHLSEQSKEKSNSSDFIIELLIDHESVIIRLRENISRFANELNDLGTCDFITGLMETHEKMAWMLRAHLK